MPLQGTDGLEAHVNANFDNAIYFTEKIRNRVGFELVLNEPEYTNITFWYVPPSLRGLQNEPDFKNKLHKVSREIGEITNSALNVLLVVAILIVTI